VIVRYVLLLIVAAGCVTALALHGPITQDPSYHQFADRRVVFGIPNFWNVISNVGFLLVGCSGLLAIRRNGPGLQMRPAYIVFFVALNFVSLGSAWYHLAPDTPALTWDRLPMAFAFMAYLAIVIGERIDARLGHVLLPFLLLCGAASVGYWHLSGDLRPYLVVQFVPLVLIAFIASLFANPNADRYGIWLILGAYSLAKVAEVLDEPIFRMQAIISGHTLKHMIAAAGLYVVVLTIRERHRENTDESHVAPLVRA
jgi:hypothetical protein